MNANRTLRPRAMKQINVDIVNHVIKYGPCGFIELYDLFGGAKDCTGKNALERFRSRLNHLTYSHLLLATGTYADRRWRAALQDALPQSGLDDCELQKPYVGVVAPPARHDLMHGPTYEPERAPVLRRGSQDFKRYASYGDRC